MDRRNRKIVSASHSMKIPNINSIKPLKPNTIKFIDILAKYHKSIYSNNTDNTNLTK